jgi:hypothetical protein
MVGCLIARRHRGQFEPQSPDKPGIRIGAVAEETVDTGAPGNMQLVYEYRGSCRGRLTPRQGPEKTGDLQSPTPRVPRCSGYSNTLPGSRQIHTILDSI